jgi:hypothetical protein
MSRDVKTMCIQFIQPNEAKMVQNPPSTTIQASKPPSGKAAGSGPAGGGAASIFSGSAGEIGGCSRIVESKDDRDVVSVPSGFSIVAVMVARTEANVLQSERTTLKLQIV